MITRPFIVLWIALQVGVPFIRKFDVPFFRYRYTTFSWAMYSRPALLYEVSLFIRDEEGQKRCIPGIERYVLGYKSPDPMPMRELYYSVEEVQDRFARLVTTVAQEQKNGQSYVASIRWIRHFQAGAPLSWEFAAEGRG